MKRLASGINPKIRANFLNHHIPMLYQTNKGGDGFVPGIIIISVTSRCNFTCHDCFNSSFRGDEDLSADVLDRVLFEAGSMGTGIVALSGEEPLMRKDLFDIIERHPKLYFQLFTNGSLITESVAERIANLGNVLPFISLEGGRALTDRRRGEGCYQRVLDAMSRLQERKVIFGSNVMVTPVNFFEATSKDFVTSLIQSEVMVIWYNVQADWEES
jgi:MoaA/NifB/PqqE/SkfB family radical SAM enzyme